MISTFVCRKVTAHPQIANGALVLKFSAFFTYLFDILLKNHRQFWWLPTWFFFQTSWWGWIFLCFLRDFLIPVWIIFSTLSIICWWWRKTYFFNSSWLINICIGTTINFPVLKAKTLKTKFYREELLCYLNFFLRKKKKEIKTHARPNHPNFRKIVAHR